MTMGRAKKMTAEFKSSRRVGGEHSRQAQFMVSNCYRHQTRIFLALYRVIIIVSVVRER